MTRRVRSDRPGLDLRVLETFKRLETPDEVNGRVDRTRLLRGTLLGRNTITAVHRFPVPELSAPGSSAAGPGGAWHRASVDFTTGLDTHAIAVLFNRVGVPAGAEACLAELAIERVEATPEQELALLARDWNRQGAPAPELGLVKRGTLLPVRRLQATRPPYDENYEHRDALFAPAPTTLRFPLRVPSGGRLTFAFALARGSRFGDSVPFFEVTVARGEERTDVFAKTVTIGSDGGGWHWRRAEVALDRWSGRRVELELAHPVRRRGGVRKGGASPSGRPRRGRAAPPG